RARGVRSDFAVRVTLNGAFRSTATNLRPTRKLTAFASPLPPVVRSVTRWRDRGPWQTARTLRVFAAASTRCVEVGFGVGFGVGAGSGAAMRGLIVLMACVAICAMPAVEGCRV